MAESASVILDRNSAPPVPWTAESIRRGMDRVVESHGPWSAHNIHLGHGIYTRERRVIGDEVRARRILQIVADITGKPFSELRVLDLGCMEGLFAIEMGLHGAEAVGIEGREANIEKARFAKEVLGLDRVQFHQGDARNLSRETYGEFDVVLCLGLLYHLDTGDQLPFLGRIAEVCTHVAVVDTHVSFAAKESFEHCGRTYSGRSVVEHRVRATDEQREELVLASLDNSTSLWLTRASLLNGLQQVGFSSVHDCQNPADLAVPDDRVAFAAIKGRPVTFHSSPLVDALSVASWPEGPRRRSSQQRWNYRIKFLKSELIRALPTSLKRFVKRLLGR